MNSIQRFNFDIFFTKTLFFILLIVLPGLIPIMTYSNGKTTVYMAFAALSWSILGSLYWIASETNNFNSRIKNVQLHLVGIVLLLSIILQLIWHFTS